MWSLIYLRHSQRDPGGIGSQLSGTWRSDAAGFLGQHSELSAQHHCSVPVCMVLAARRISACRNSVRHQFFGWRNPRRAGYRHKNITENKTLLLYVTTNVVWWKTLLSCLTGIMNLILTIGNNWNHARIFSVWIWGNTWKLCNNIAASAFLPPRFFCVYSCLKMQNSTYFILIPTACYCIKILFMLYLICIGVSTLYRCKKCKISCKTRIGGIPRKKSVPIPASAAIPCSHGSAKRASPHIRWDAIGSSKPLRSTSGSRAVKRENDNKPHWD